jgi:ThiF family
MHPTLKPAMRRSWRDRESVQFGLDPAHAVVLGPVDEPAARFLKLLDGTRGTEVLRRDAAAVGLAPERVERLLGALAAGGVLEDADSVVALDGVLRRRPAVLGRLRPDLAALSVVHPEPGAAAGLMAARRTARVRVHGAGRVGASVAAVLTAAGVGHVEVVDGGQVEPWDTAPAGCSAAQVGERRGAAARGVLRRVWPDPRPVARRGLESVDGPAPPLGLAVFAPRDGLGGYAPDPRVAEPLLAAGIPHLYVGVLEGLGSVGPLVLPGRTGCAGCLEAGRAQEDPAWPRMLAQLRSGRQPGVVACDVALATSVAGFAAARALAFLDWRARRTTGPGAGADPGPPGAGRRVEFSLPGMDSRTYDVAPHPACGCAAALGEERATMAV